MDNDKPAIKEIIVKENEISIETDLEDGWFSIIDRDNDWYDEMGAVIFKLEDLKELIDGLIWLHKEYNG